MTPLLLLHGAIGSEETFDSLKELLKDTFDVHTMSFPGHGKDQDINSDFSINGFSEKVIEYMDRHQLQKVNLFGYSLGGYVALNVTVKHPEKINDVFTFATIFNWNEETAAAQSRLLNPEKIEEKIPAFAKHLAQLHGENKWKDVLKKTAGLLHLVGAEKNLNKDVFENIKHRVCISVGDRDTTVTLEESIAAQRALPNSELLVIPQTSHPFEKADHQLLSYFIKRFFTATR
jgi:pimeloyl-ACP methyl ester carboxylesterase